MRVRAGAVAGARREPEPARLIEPSQKHEIVDDRMNPGHKAVSTKNYID